jgi:hypothetical protein
VEVGTGGGRGVVALYCNLTESGKVVAVVCDVGGTPVNRSTGPFDGSGGVGVGTTGPDGQLDTGGSLRVVPLVGCRVPGL